MLLAWIDGQLVPAGEARVSAYDQGFRAGEGVFETFRAYGAHVFRLDAHLRRARSGAAELGFDPGPPQRLRDAVRTTAGANLAALDGADSALRLTATPGPIDSDSVFPGVLAGTPTVVVTSHRLRPDARSAAEGVTAVTVPWSRELPHVKAVSYLAASLARRTARQRGADEALLTDADQVLEGAASNVFAVTGRTLITPPPEAGLLAGVTREVVIDVAGRVGLEVREAALAVADLHAADEAVLTGTTREVLPLVAIDGELIGSGRPGPVAARLRDAYRDEVERERGAAD